MKPEIAPREAVKLLIHVLSHGMEDEALWQNLVERSPRPDVYFRPEYLRLSETIGGGKTIALICGGRTPRALCPLMVRRGPPVSDAFTPYGYGGLLLLSQPGAESEETSCILESIRQWCKSEGLVSCLLRMHPLLIDQFRLTGLDAQDFIVREHGQTTAVDLTQWDSAHQHIAGLKKNRISDLSYARKSLSVTIAEGADGVRKHLSTFRDIYEQTMWRLQTRTFYHFPEAYYAELQEYLRPYLMLGLASSRGQFVGASLFLYDHDFAHYHLSGTTVEGRKLKASTLLVNQAAEWARSKGCKWLHLGGGNHPNDGLSNFKAAIAGAPFPYIYITIIADHDRYNQLIETTPPIWPYLASEGAL
jgi:hypothetical protein